MICNCFRDCQAPTHRATRHLAHHTRQIVLAFTSQVFVFAGGRTDESTSATMEKPYEGVELQFGMDYAEMVGFVEDNITDVRVSDWRTRLDRWERATRRSTTPTTAAGHLDALVRKTKERT